MLKRLIPIVQIVTLLAFLVASGTALAGDAYDQLKTSIDRVIVLLKDDSLKAPERKPERREKILKILEERFDFAEMGKRALARHWKTVSQKDKEEFVAAFSKLMQKSYIRKIEKYTDEEVVFKSKRPKGKYYYIYTDVVSGEKTIPVNYSLHPVGDNWRVYDVSIEGVSLVKNYRTQFNVTIRKKKFTGLMSRLKEKVKKLESKLEEEKGV